MRISPLSGKRLAVFLFPAQSLSVAGYRRCKKRCGGDFAAPDCPGLSHPLWPKVTTFFV
jgi:hypothetical protein